MDILKFTGNVNELKKHLKEGQRAKQSGELLTGGGPARFKVQTPAETQQLTEFIKMFNKNTFKFNL